MAKSRLINVALDNGVLTFNVGEAGSFTVALADLTDDIRERATVHGIVQKISDAAAMPKDELTGNAKKDAATKLAAMRKVAERIGGPDGEWSGRSGDGSGPVAGLIYRAFAEWAENMATAAKKPVPSDETLRAKYDGMDRKAKLALRSVPEIAAIIERLKSERPAKSSEMVDTNALLDELGIA